MFFVFSKAIEVEQLPGKIYITHSVIWSPGSSSTSPRISYAVQAMSQSQQKCGFMQSYTFFPH